MSKSYVCRSIGLKIFPGFRWKMWPSSTPGFKFFMHHWCELGYSWNNFRLTSESFQRIESNWNYCKSVQLYHLCPLLWKAYLCANYIYNIHLKTWIFGTFVNHKNESFLDNWVSWNEFRCEFWWYAVFTFPEGELDRKFRPPMPVMSRSDEPI